MRDAYLAREMDVDQAETKLLAREVTHLFVDTPVVLVQRRQVVEPLVKEVLHPGRAQAENWEKNEAKARGGG